MPEGAEGGGGFWRYFGDKEGARGGKRGFAPEV